MLDVEGNSSMTLYQPCRRFGEPSDQIVCGL